jgi:hypothetical protein
VAVLLMLFVACRELAGLKDQRVEQQVERPLVVLFFA